MAKVTMPWGFHFTASLLQDSGRSLDYCKGDPTSENIELTTDVLYEPDTIDTLLGPGSYVQSAPINLYHSHKVIGKDHTVEKVITEVECETEGFRDHKAPAVIENVIVKVECEAGSARDHNAPEAKVKVRGHETNDAGYTEIFLQDRYADIVRVAPENTVYGKSSRVEKKAKFKPISERDNPIQCDHLSSETYKLSLMSIGPHFEIDEDDVLSSLNKLQPPPEILASTISFVSLEDGELSKEMATYQYELADTGVWVCTKHFTREELAAFADSNRLIYFRLRIIIARAYFDLPKILKEPATVSEQVIDTVECILRGEKPAEWDFVIRVVPSKEIARSRSTTTCILKCFVGRARDMMRSKPYKGCYMSSLMPEDMPVIISLAYGAPVPLPTNLDRIQELLTKTLGMFNVNISTRILPEWERAICREAVALDVMLHKTAGVNFDHLKLNHDSVIGRAFASICTRNNTNKIVEVMFAHVAAYRLVDKVAAQSLLSPAVSPPRDFPTPTVVVIDDDDDVVDDNTDSDQCIYIRLRIIIARSYFDLSNLLKEPTTVSEQTIDTVGRILRGEKPSGWDTKFKVGPYQGDGWLPLNSYYMHSTEFHRARKDFQDTMGIVLDKPIINLFPHFFPEDMPVIVSLMYGVPVPLPTNFDRMKQLFNNIRSIFNKTDPRSFARLAQLILFWMCSGDAMPSAKAATIGVFAEMAMLQKAAGVNFDQYRLDHDSVIGRAFAALECAPINTSRIVAKMFAHIVSCRMVHKVGLSSKKKDALLLGAFLAGYAVAAAVTAAAAGAAGTGVGAAGTGAFTTGFFLPLLAGS
ncbi:hypothetical protein PRIPAC_71427 [Pristionchus pacificus]|uniref:Uncharacterized protein n=1 Tax=Pristionchus pacificus TaxID=54126 RepID=A0A2A6C5P6_PRIPA|nr:hypothetical protein PRIPAC_71427 [Pristionchus pacificus]|eukprot:PDM73469.1 hypothetical protein PRIPAC_40825 [Pristionchus pacificus]